MPHPLPANSANAIDLRSDTVTRPSPGMMAAMASAPLGDDVFGDDPTVNALQAEAAEMAGKEAGLFFPSGTQSNLAGLMAHCGRGDEYIVGQQAHTYRYEGGGAAVLGSIQPQPIENAPDGTLPLEKIEAAIKPIGVNFARTRLLALENTIAGQVLPAGYTQRAEAIARKAGLAFHLDGARAWNAAVASGQTLAEICQPFDSVSLCLSKGLGTPVGSVLVGARPVIESARRWRKVLGGGMRQVGVLAAAGRYAIQHNIARLAEDHSNAALLAKSLTGLLGAGAVRYTGTNMVFVNPVPGLSFQDLGAFLQARNILVEGGSGLRLVTHLDVSTYQINQVVEAIGMFLADAGRAASSAA
ncbi:low-specificity L-threonine aldolase [Acidisphaera sp. L21]|uniref:low-specificity L-threonine aldolase n=1 Tax=Acidisphaera sp. L21 TaxID=1641851 RepID=UPI00131E331E|nr:low-specificity L-threonine aldolase [Acidisphaera sp. L21]